MLRRERSDPEARQAEEAKLRAAERVAAGVLVEAIAPWQLLAQPASRLADGSIRLARARSSQNSVLSHAGDWPLLAPPLRFASVAALRAEALAHPHLALCPRHAARRNVVSTPGRTEAVRYDTNGKAWSPRSPTTTAGR